MIMLGFPSNAQDETATKPFEEEKAMTTTEVLINTSLILWKLPT
jgi:hypothetical protein